MIPCKCIHVYPRVACRSPIIFITLQVGVTPKHTHALNGEDERDRRFSAGLYETNLRAYRGKSFLFRVFKSISFALYTYQWSRTCAP